MRFGFVVGRSVGNAVHRNRVKRRLRAIARELLPSVAAGTAVVVRALPPSAARSFDDLSADLRLALTRSGALS